MSYLIVEIPSTCSMSFRKFSSFRHVLVVISSTRSPNINDNYDLFGLWQNDNKHSYSVESTIFKHEHDTYVTVCTPVFAYKQAGDKVSVLFSSSSLFRRVVHWIYFIVTLYLHRQSDENCISCICRCMAVGNDFFPPKNRRI